MPGSLVCGMRNEPDVDSAFLSASCRSAAASALQPDILSGQLADFVGAHNAGKYPVGITRLHFLE